MLNSTPPLVIDAIREQFFGLDQGWILMDNAGGSQILRSGVARINDFFRTAYVQHGGSYALSMEAEARLWNAREAMALMMNAHRPEEIIFAGSSTVALANLAQGLRKSFLPGDEIILTSADHESNATCWDRLTEFGVVIKTWSFSRESTEFDLEDLRALLSDRTRLVCIHHASNIFGLTNPVRDIADIVHSAGAKLCVDGVAFAPHRAIDVQALDADYYVFSAYKAYGPHCGVLYGKHDLLLELDSIYHHYYGKADIPFKMEPGDPNYELTASLPAIPDYLCSLGATGAELERRVALEKGFEAITQHENSLLSRLFAFLTAHPAVRIIGTQQNWNSGRLPIVSFRVRDVHAEQICLAMDKQRIAIRWGKFAANRIFDRLDINDNGGIVRISLAHYNTLEEVDRLTAALAGAIEDLHRR
ncbi:cysteine desulfurase-like protein [Phyllobacterium zundukense]|uniref:Cysteine desulfurase-like protein n=1 Tax=Phyllobacterium zundukense TaxID=1867719 RepID=A0ACD4CUY7_9HYPH|nr:cysteine desulfurase-like protein [Phyllobacterium zundukense]UXN57394.1 cysteine desulfurase-like protein [Phyllobacterium zundukense]